MNQKEEDKHISMDCGPYCECAIDEQCPGWWASIEKHKEPRKVVDLLRKGVKYDQGKVQWDLFPPEALEEIGKVLTYGAKKYAPDNWRHVEGWKRRYFAALMRHMWAYWKGEKTDEETGLSHLAHAGCCLIFLLGKEMEKES